VGDEVAPFSAARRSAKPGTNAFISPRSFGFGCAALRNIARGRPNALEKQLRHERVRPWEDQCANVFLGWSGFLALLVAAAPR